MRTLLLCCALLSSFSTHAIFGHPFTRHEPGPPEYIVPAGQEGQFVGAVVPAQSPFKSLLISASINGSSHENNCITCAWCARKFKGRGKEGRFECHVKRCKINNGVRTTGRTFSFGAKKGGKLSPCSTCNKRISRAWMIVHACHRASRTKLPN